MESNFSESFGIPTNDEMLPLGHELITPSYLSQDLTAPLAQELDVPISIQGDNDTTPLCPFSLQFDEMASIPDLSPWWSIGFKTLPNFYENMPFDLVGGIVQPEISSFPAGVAQPCPSGISSQVSSSPRHFFTEKSKAISQEPVHRGLKDRERTKPARYRTKQCWDHGCNGQPPSWTAHESQSVVG
ncbi:hypothetical protein B0T10DRAFT_463318 [Thelonectria olida]|uniref:Uncharacterized protein n=1 Tax=Thelonectria olida TaxID=1576542 RepID=A0A9P9ALX5_9HYPO|nr:hypothetical protein B0T10DRAFT_463318 [Thelonectria olida]